MDPDRLSIENRITRIETRLEELMTNHIPHLEAKMDRNVIMLITVLTGVVINLLMLLLKK